MRIAVVRTIAALTVVAALVPVRDARAAEGPSDEAVDKAIAKAVAFLWKAQKGDGSWPAPGDNKQNFIHEHPMGCTALPVYALLESGVKVTDPRMTKALLYLAKTQSVKTYSLGVRANVWLAAGRQDKRYLQMLNRDVAALVSSSNNGAYSYDCNGDGASGATRKDNSASQYALLGAWAGARAYLEIPPQYWHIVMRHWIGCQNADGGWGYLPGRPPHDATTPTMTTAGVASLLVCYDNLVATDAAMVRCKRSKLIEGADKPIAAGLAWFDQNFVNSFTGEIRGLYYYLYGVERVGLASGYKYFGKIDWYKQGAVHILRSQQGNGSWKGRWGGPVANTVGTSFALLFLIRGRNAVIFNKLEFDGDWNNRPRDLANLTKWMSKTFERTVNWQIINLKVPVREWHDAPLLYISASRKPQFGPGDIDKLRTFVNQGGTILGVSECGGAVGFKQGMRDVYQKLFPKYPLTLCKSDHPIYSRKVHFDLPGRPKFHIASNGVRPLIVHTDEDIPLCWQMRRTVTRKWAYEAAANVVRYVTDRVSMVRPRGTTHWPAPHAGTCSRTVKLARLKYNGNYDPEPLAYERFGNLLAAQHKIKLDLVGPIDIKDLAASGATVAALTGTGELKLTDAQRKDLKAFVAKGGLLVIDAAGGSRAFADSAEKTLKEMFGAFKLRVLASTSTLYRRSGMAISGVKYRRRTALRLGRRTQPNLKGIMVDSRVGVVFSREDITAGLVGYPSWTVDGYQPESAFELMRNIVASAK